MIRVPAAAAAAILVFGLSACSGDNNPPENAAPEAPATSSAPPPPALTKQSMPSSDDISTSLLRFQQPTDITDASEMVRHDCQQGEWADTGTPTADETSIRQRAWEAPSRGEAQTVVLQYADPAAAEQAYQTIAGWAAACGDGFKPEGETNPVSIGREGQAQFNVWFQPKQSVRPNSGDLHHIGVIQRGHRVVWAVVTQDNAREGSLYHSLDPTDENPHPFYSAIPDLSSATNR